MICPAKTHGLAEIGKQASKQATGRTLMDKWAFTEQ